MTKTTRHRILGVVIAAAFLLSTTGCFLPYDPPIARMAIVNETEHRLGIHIGESGDEFSLVRPGETRQFALSGSAPDCSEWTLRVFTEDGARTASIGPPVCDGDEWVITEADLHPVEP